MTIVDYSIELCYCYNFAIQGFYYYQKLDKMDYIVYFYKAKFKIFIISNHSSWKMRVITSLKRMKK